MEEDDEVVLKNSALYFHLLDSGFDDFESTEVTEKKYVDTVTDQHINDSEVEINTEDYKNYEKLVNTVLESNLVFSDDVEAVKNFSIHCSGSCSIWRSPYFKLLYKTSASSVICFLCSFYAFKNKPSIYIPLSLVPSVLCLVKCGKLIYINSQEKKNLKGLIRIMKDFSMMLQKCIQFIQESEILAYNSISQNKMKLSVVGQSDNFLTRCQVMVNLRNIAYDTLRTIVLNLKRNIYTLVKTYPLKPSVDELNFYLAFLSEDDLHCSEENSEPVSVDKLQKLKYVCLLLQSEFLKRLCLNLNPSLWRNQISIRNIFELIKGLKNIYNQEFTRIREVFVTYYTYEKPSDSKFPPHADWIYKEAYTKICSVSLNLQSILKDSRQIEEFLESVRLENENYIHVISKLDDLSENLAKKYANSREALEDFRTYILRLKSKNSPKTNLPIFTQLTQESEVINKTSILVGVSDFRPPCPDEIFIGVSTQEQKPERENLDEDYIVANKCSKLLISELKLALQDKAQEWKEREKIALQNKNLEDSLSEDELPTEMMSRKRNLNRRKVHFSSSEGSENEKLASDSSDEDDGREKRSKMVFPVGTSFAEKIAQASSQWALKSQDYVASSEGEGSD